MFENSLIIERWIRKGIALGAGVGFKVSRIEQDESRGEYRLISLPLSFSADTADDLLDPARGGKIVLQAAPNQDLESKEVTFLKASSTVTRYLSLFKAPGSVLALRGSIGSIIGQSRLRIPADERFYAGGGGSIRGYAYQSVGPFEGKPTGGRSFAELSAEIRVRVSERLGMVFFLDGGNAFASKVPLEGSLRWGTGIGLRYFTPIGPIRADLGIPLDRRPDVDDRYQFYVSIGQAF